MTSLVRVHRRAVASVSVSVYENKTVGSELFRISPTVGFTNKREVVERVVSSVVFSGLNSHRGRHLHL